MDPTHANDHDPLRGVNAFAADTSSHLRDTITLADQKAGFLFGTATAILAFLHTTGATQTMLTDLRGGKVGFGDIVMLIALLSLVGAAIGALLVVVPRAPKATKGLVAARAVAEYGTASEYVAAVMASDAATLARAKLEYSWTLARISARKYWYVNIALRSGFIGLVMTVVYLAFG